MKKSDFTFLLVATAIFLPFFISDDAYEWYKTFNATHGMVMSFLKFAILSTMGEMIGLRISTGVYINRTFGIIPRMVVWGLLGMGINMAMIIFSKGVPMFMEYMGMANASSTINGEMCFEKIMIALSHIGSHEQHFCPRLYDSSQDNRHPHRSLRRFGKGTTHSHPHETDYDGTELGSVVGIRIQENHSFVLVSGTYHHFPAPSEYESAVCRHIGHRTGSVVGRCSQKEIKK